jgi:hypothetical protein
MVLLDVTVPYPEIKRNMYLMQQAPCRRTAIYAAVRVEVDECEANRRAPESMDRV